MSELRFPFSEALPIAEKFIAFLEGHCRRVVIAGSLRRRKESVKDIEILFVPAMKNVPDPNDMFGGRIEISAGETAIAQLLKLGVIAKRPNKKGIFTWGEQNKLGIHVASGIPIDFFSTDEDRFWNALFVRTGPLKLNKDVAQRALDRGWKWHAYGNGFARGTRERLRVRSEHDVFKHVGLQYKDPWDR